jgi:hypothetical protein
LSDLVVLSPSFGDCARPDPFAGDPNAGAASVFPPNENDVLPAGFVPKLKLFAPAAGPLLLLLLVVLGTAAAATLVPVPKLNLGGDLVVSSLGLLSVTLGPGLASPQDAHFATVLSTSA